MTEQDMIVERIVKGIQDNDPDNLYELCSYTAMHSGPIIMLKVCDKGGGNPRFESRWFKLNEEQHMRELNGF